MSRARRRNAALRREGFEVDAPYLDQPEIDDRPQPSLSRADMEEIMRSEEIDEIMNPLSPVNPVFLNQNFIEFAEGLVFNISYVEDNLYFYKSPAFTRNLPSPGRFVAFIEANESILNELIHLLLVMDETYGYDFPAFFKNSRLYANYLSQIRNEFHEKERLFAGILPDFAEIRESLTNEEKAYLAIMEDSRGRLTEISYVPLLQLINVIVRRFRHIQTFRLHILKGANLDDPV